MAAGTLEFGAEDIVAAAVVVVVVVAAVVVGEGVPPRPIAVLYTFCPIPVCGCPPLSRRIICQRPESGLRLIVAYGNVVPRRECNSNQFIARARARKMQQRQQQQCRLRTSKLILMRDFSVVVVDVAAAKMSAVVCLGKWILLSASGTLDHSTATTITAATTWPKPRKIETSKKPPPLPLQRRWILEMGEARPSLQQQQRFHIWASVHGRHYMPYGGMNL